MPLPPTMIATGASMSISASTATIRDWTSIAILFHISTRGMALQTTSSITKEMESSRIGRKRPA